MGILTIEPIVVSDRNTGTASYILQPEDLPSRKNPESDNLRAVDGKIAGWDLYSQVLTNPVPENVLRRDVATAAIRPIRPGTKSANNLTTDHRSGTALLE